MSTRRPMAWILAVGMTAVAVAALLIAWPAAVGQAMLIFVMAGLPALYRLRRVFPRASSRSDGSADANADIKRLAAHDPHHAGRLRLVPTSRRVK